MLNNRYFLYILAKSATDNGQGWDLQGCPCQPIKIKKCRIRCTDGKESHSISTQQSFGFGVSCGWNETL